MDAGKKEERAALGRRQFLRSVFGFGGLAEAREEAMAAQPSASKFFWADLSSGQMGFPSGHGVPAGMPGSVMKLVTAAALFDGKFVLPEQQIECRGSYKHNKQSYNCLYAHGMVDLVRAIGLSCNVYFAQASQKMSMKALFDCASAFGLDKSVEEFGAGKFASFEDCRSKDIVPYALGLSPDIQPSALQILRLAGLIARDGRLPYLHSAERPDASKEDFALELRTGSFQVLRQGMKIASREGTAKKLDPENKLKLAVKTGTTPHGKAFQSWICGYFPWDHPRYAFCLRSPSGSSQEAAVPEARKFLFAVEWP